MPRDPASHAGGDAKLERRDPSIEARPTDEEVHIDRRDQALYRDMPSVTNHGTGSNDPSLKPHVKSAKAIHAEDPDGMGIPGEAVRSGHDQQGSGFSSSDDSAMDDRHLSD